MRKGTLLSVVILSVGAGAGACADAKPEERAHQGNPQLVDRTRTPNDANAGIAKSLEEQIGAGRGDLMTPKSSAFIIARDPFRAIRRGRQLFHRKFTRDQGQGPLVNDGIGDIGSDATLGAGLADSCAACHGRPRGSAGTGGDVATRPDSRDAPHLFGLGLKEMLADEITADLRAIRDEAIAEATGSSKHKKHEKKRRGEVRRRLVSKGIDFGWIVARADGSVDTSQVEGVDPDLRVRPFFAHGGTISIREFVVGAWRAEMGLEAVDPDLAHASSGGRIVTPAGMVLDGSIDRIEAPPARTADEDPDGDGKTNEIPQSLVDFMEFYLLNYFKPATYDETSDTRAGERLFDRIGCTSCHVKDLVIEHDRRVADVETVYDPKRGIFNNLFATATASITTVDDGSGFPTIKKPAGKRFVVRNIFTDFKRHDLGPEFHERQYDGTIRTMFMTTPLWGVGTTAPYGHDGRSINLNEVILRHGGEAEQARRAYALLPYSKRLEVLEFLRSLVLFPPDDTASNLDPGSRKTRGFPQFGHGSIALNTLFEDPSDPE